MMVLPFGGGMFGQYADVLTLSPPTEFPTIVVYARERDDVMSLRTSPPSVAIGSHETFSLGIDCSLLLQSGEDVDGGGPPTAFFYDDSESGEDVSDLNLIGSPGINGNVVIPVITGLLPQHNYRLVTVIHPNAVDYREAVTIIPCPE